jgi:hypothetical protein
MKDLRPFEIEIQTLKFKRHEYEYDIDASFFTSRAWPNWLAIVPRSFLITRLT